MTKEAHRAGSQPSGLGVGGPFGPQARMEPPFPALMQAGTGGREEHSQADFQVHILFSSVPTRLSRSRGLLCKGPRAAGSSGQDHQQPLHSGPAGGQAAPISGLSLVILGTVMLPPHAVPQSPHLHPLSKAVVKMNYTGKRLRTEWYSMDA